MKFSHTLATHLTPEWRQQYIAYADLKDLILNAVQNVPHRGSGVDPRESYFLRFEEDFFSECEKELKKVDTFFAEKLAEAIRRHDNLVANVDSLFHNFRTTSVSAMTLGANFRAGANSRLKDAKLKQLKLAYSELYLNLVLLQNYQVLNHTGFRKILKKYDKLIHSEMGKKWFNENVDTAAFYSNHELNTLIEDVEYVFTTFLENGDRARAMKRLRVPRLIEVQNPFTLFRVGLFTGAFIVLFITAIIVCSHDVLEGNLFKYYFPFFRGPLLLITHIFLIAVNVWGWRRGGVNHILIFEINPRKHFTYSHLMELAGTLAVLWALSILGFLYANYFNISRFTFPLLLLLIMLCIVFVPLPTLDWSSRVWFLKVLGRLMSAPFFPVKFPDFWLGDQLNSLTTSWVDYKNLLCFYIRNPSWKEDFDLEECVYKNQFATAIVLCLPAWFRFAQCMRQYYDKGVCHPYLTNAGKYATTFAVVLFSSLMDIYKDMYSAITENPFLWCFLFSQLVSSLYGCLWDILGDFGLFKTFREENMFLRENIIYSKTFYYFAIVENIILRFFWLFAFCMVVRKYVQPLYMQTIAGLLEIVRRHIWNYLRLENEHLYNVGQFRAVRDIFIAPIDETNITDLENLMDKPDGVTNRN